MGYSNAVSAIRSALGLGGKAKQRADTEHLGRVGAVFVANDEGRLFQARRRHRRRRGGDWCWRRQVERLRGAGVQREERRQPFARDDVAHDDGREALLRRRVDRALALLPGEAEDEETVARDITSSGAGVVSNVAAQLEPRVSLLRVSGDNAGAHIEIRRAPSDQRKSLLTKIELAEVAMQRAHAPADAVRADVLEEEAVADVLCLDARERRAREDREDEEANPSNPGAKIEACTDGKRRSHERVRPGRARWR